MFVTIHTTETGEVAGIGVALNALVPLVFVFPAVYFEILLVMVKSGRIPSRFRMAILAGSRETRCRVIRVIGRRIVRRVAAKAGIGRVVVIPVVAGRAIIGNSRMRTVQGIVVIMDRECCRRPSGSSRVAHGTVCWYI